MVSITHLALNNIWFWLPFGVLWGGVYSHFCSIKSLGKRERKSLTFSILVFYSIFFPIWLLVLIFITIQKYALKLETSVLIHLWNVLNRICWCEKPIFTVFKWLISISILYATGYSSSNTLIPLFIMHLSKKNQQPINT